MDFTIPLLMQLDQLVRARFPISVWFLLLSLSIFAHLMSNVVFLFIPLFLDSLL